MSRKIKELPFLRNDWQRISVFKEKNPSNKSEGSISDELQTRNQRLIQEILWVFDSGGQHEFTIGSDFYEIHEASHLDAARIFCSLAIKLDSDVFPRGLTDRSV